MRTLDGHDSGVIDAPAATPAATAPPAEPLLAPAVQQGPIQNVPLGQLPADVAPPEPPAFTLSRKESEDGGLPPLGAPHPPAPHRTPCRGPPPAAAPPPPGGGGGPRPTPRRYSPPDSPIPPRPCSAPRTARSTTRERRSAPTPRACSRVRTMP
ncbi:hypothetical protein [Nocardia wallacei]|uniref:hypothetical protein n=1 Tax=Nocardia wallacei TaxID=480035 RepID=UPI0024545840|nr:hypothetical protein [Nocardia wallacei]